MNSNESLPLQLKPLISYPREAQVGKTYLVSIDVQLATSETSWNFPEEEYTIGFILNTQPYFTCKPLHGESWPSIVLHRYGGTYGPAEYLFTAADHEISSGHMSITLINGWGIPMTKLQLPCTVKLESSIQAESREITLPVPQKTTTRPETPDKPAPTPEPEEYSIAAMLAKAGWFVVDDSDSTIDADTIIRSATGIAVRVYSYNTATRDPGADFLLLINGEITGRVTQEGKSVLLIDQYETVGAPPTSSIFRTLSLENIREPLPFVYKMQGEEIHFTNNLEPEARSRIIFHFHRPETFAYWLEQAPVGTPNDLNALLRSRLRRMPAVPETLPVAQIEAITKLEASLAQNHPRTLIQMADSTNMLINSIYQLLQYGGARSVLYLTENLEVARKVLSEFAQLIRTDSNWNLLYPHNVQASTADEIFKITVKALSHTICIAGIGSIYHLLSNTPIEDREKSGADKGSTEPSISYHADLPIEFFDVIFLVECFDKLHREYRPLLDYFDAFFVGVGINIPSRVTSLFNRNLAYKASQRPTQWPMDNHTHAKHEILHKYLEAWLPIMTKNHDHVLIIDGFAGPGVYIGGEIGSPLIALDVLREHIGEEVRQKSVRFLFIEKDSKRCNYLKDLLQKEDQKRRFPPSLQCDIVCGDFTEVLNQELQTFEKESAPGTFGKHVPAIFAFIDPFGYSQTPMNTISRLMRLASCEILLTFMYEEINRFITADYRRKVQQYDALFGTHEWIYYRAKTAQEREQFICELYTKQLHEMGHVKYVRYFRMVNTHNATDYFLFFGTNDLKGLEKMKDAMWAIDRDGGYMFSDRTNQNQLQLFEKGPDYDLLKRLIVSRFKGMTVPIEEVNAYVLIETAFRTAGYKDNVLKPMEDASELKVITNGIKRKSHTYPDGISLSFQQEMKPLITQMDLW